MLRLKELLLFYCYIPFKLYSSVSISWNKRKYISLRFLLMRIRIHVSLANNATGKFHRPILIRKNFCKNFHWGFFALFIVQTRRPSRFISYENFRKSDSSKRYTFIYLLFFITSTIFIFFKFDCKQVAHLPKLHLVCISSF